MAEQQTATTNKGPAKPTTPETLEATGTVQQQQQTEPVDLNAAAKADAEAAEEVEPETTAEETESGDAEEAKPAPKAPDEYEIKSPIEGAELDQDLLRVFLSHARQRDMTNEEAQSFIDDIVPALQARQESIVEGVREQWKTELDGDAKIGGKKLPETLRTANRFIDAYEGADEVRTLLDQTGFGGHPTFVRFFAWAGAKVTPETKVVRGVSGGGDPRSRDPVTRLAESYDKTE